jgi:membrane-associated phospholipid phosphatase
MAPPWMASRDGFIGEVHRITSRGWAGTGLDRANIVLQGMGNQVAAMPSLHAGIAFLVAIYGVQRLRHPLRWLLLAYPAAMSLALVYFAEHYVVDVLAGGLLALVVTLGVGRWERRLLPVERPRETAPGAGTVGP